MVPRALDRLSRVFGHLPYSLVLRLVGPAFKSSLPPARREFLTNELKKNDPRFLRAQTRAYLAYLDGTARSPGDSAMPGSGLGLLRRTRRHRHHTRRARAARGSSARDLVEIADTGHFALNQKPDEIAAIVLQAVTSAAG